MNDRLNSASEACAAPDAVEKTHRKGELLSSSREQLTRVFHLLQSGTTPSSVGLPNARASLSGSPIMTI